MAVDILTLDPRWRRSFRGLKADVEDATRRTLREVSPSHKYVGKLDVTIVFASDAEVRKLNAQFRSKDKPTNVLAFPGGEDAYLGDIILGYETVKREAKVQNKTFRAHTLHLVVHGMLHLMGHDHEDKKDAKRMESLEIKILARMTIANPYEAE